MEVEMTVDKLNLTLGTGATNLDKLSSQSVEAKVRSLKVNSEQTATGTTDSVEFSAQAKGLQETEKVLRFALEKLESFDDVRQERLSDVQDRINQDFYMDDDIDEAVSERMFSNQEIAQVARRHLEVKQQLDNLHAIDNEETPIDEDKLQSIRDRVAAGYYNDPEVIEATADKLLETII
jgi:hypothetical protein